MINGKKVEDVAENGEGNGVSYPTVGEEDDGGSKGT